jgi:hypothetical protein
MTDGHYLLRWRFEYADGKATKYGMWSHPGASPADMAVYQTKQGLALAMIEGRHSATKEDKILAVCPGDDFCNFQWVAEAHFNPFGGGVTQQNVVGMKLVSRYDEVTVFASGRVTQDARTLEDQQFNYASY